MAITRKEIQKQGMQLPETGQSPIKPAPKEEAEQTLIEAERAYRKGLVTIHDLIAPSVMRVTPSFLEVSGQFVRTLFATTYPRHISVGWFAPIINYPSTIDISMFFYPISSGIVLKQLRNQVGNLQAQVSANTEKGSPRDPKLETALRDIEELRDNLTTGVEKFFQYALYVTMYASNLEELDSLTEKIESIFGTAGVFTRRALWQTEQGFNSTLPLGQDELDIGFNMNSSPIAASFPFISSELTSDRGILYGINLHNNSLVIFDRFTLQNANMVCFATSGSGKSVDRNSDILIKDQENKVVRTKIGALVDELGKNREFERVDEELEGIYNPGVSVYTFNQKLEGEWSRVSLAARKKAPDYVYRFHMKSGREIIVTGDHNMLILRDGLVVAAKSEDVKIGEVIPVPKAIPEPSSSTGVLNLLVLLENSSHLYLDGCQSFIAEHHNRLKSVPINPAYDRYLHEYCRDRRIPIKYFQQICEYLKIKPTDIFIRKIQIGSCRSRRKDTSLPALFELKAEFMRLLGYIVSEGTIAYDYIIISNRDEEVVADIRDCLKKLEMTYFNRKADGSFVIASRVFFELLKAIGIAGRSDKKCVPSFAFNASNHLVAEFLRAYFEGDGGVEKHTVTACSKSKGLISDLSYLLLRFGIVTRIAWKTKTAQTGVSGQYGVLTISGQEGLKNFTEKIRFITKRKNERLSHVINKKANTNVDTIPAQGIIQELYNLFAPQLHGLQEIIEIKNGSYQPSRVLLQRVIEAVERRIEHFIRLGIVFGPLKGLLPLGSIIREGVVDSHKNRQLWLEIGQSWRLMKNDLVAPRVENVFKAIKVVNGQKFCLSDLKDTIHCGFKELDLYYNDFDGSLQSALMEKNKTQNTGYGLIYRSAQHVCHKYEQIYQNLPKVKDCVSKLKKLVQAEILWDPIVSIDKLNNEEEYVYDLTVDNEVFLAGYGGLFVHNSYAIKVEILRSLMMGTNIIVIDPEMEYKHLSDAVGGTYINVSLASEANINPFDLPRPTTKTASVEDIIRSAIITLKGLLRLMLGEFTTQEDSLLDKALLETYRKKDITPESDLTRVEPPILSDLEDILTGMEGTGDLVLRLKKYTEGTFSGLLNNPTNIDMRNQLVVFSVRDLEDELRPIAIYTIVNYIWNVVRSELKKRLLVVDEAWWLMQQADSAKFMYALIKRCRKYYLGVTTITQDVNDFLLSPYGQAIVNNSALQLLLRQSQAAIDLVAKTFLLTEGERLLLLDAEVGNGIFFAGSKHVAMRVIASYSEDQLITSDPKQLLEIEQSKREFQAESQGDDEMDIG